MKTLSILGSTGSIGRQTLDVVKSNPDKLHVHALAAGKNVRALEAQVRIFRPALAVIMDEQGARELKGLLSDLPVKVEQGMQGLLAAVSAPEADTVLNSLSGRIGLEPTLRALDANKTVALANKETLVAGGELVMAAAARSGARLLPVDSEHSAVFQCLEDNPGSVEKIILTASGGPFRGWRQEQLAQVTAEDALRHPNWDMGAKITIDSATLMNKGLEVIEAHYLFGVDYNEIEVVIHPQSIIHSMVQYKDGSVLAQLGRPDMRLPIQYALSYPERWENAFERLDLVGKNLTFLEPDLRAFPALALAYEAGKRRGTLPAVMNAANEVAVHAFLEGKCSFPGIYESVSSVCGEHKVLDSPNLETILEADAWARARTQEVLSC
ncbi:1-deoxy-D-xylulose-5-phosphate reductoisomerase [Paradesulfitobacterium aromaticivorans]